MCLEISLITFQPHLKELPTTFLSSTPNLISIKTIKDSTSINTLIDSTSLKLTMKDRKENNSKPILLISLSFRLLSKRHPSTCQKILANGLWNSNPYSTDFFLLSQELWLLQPDWQLSQ